MSPKNIIVQILKSLYRSISTLVNEIYPTNISSLAVGITVAVVQASATISVKVFTNLEDILTVPGLSILNAVFGLILIIWGALTIPDNRGKSLGRISKTNQRKSFQNLDSNLACEIKQENINVAFEMQ